VATFQPYRIDVPQRELDDLRERLRVPVGQIAKPWMVGRRGFRKGSCRILQRIGSTGYTRFGAQSGD
jgi:hypothetical protein